MNYKIVKIRSNYTVSGQLAILITYTGGTIVMVHDAIGSLVPFTFIKVMETMSKLCRIRSRIDSDIFSKTY